MRRCHELSLAASKKAKASNGVQDSSAIVDEEMELDEQTHDGDGWEADGMDMEEPEQTAKSNILLTEAVQYGQQLRLDYPNDERGGDKKMLDDIFSLVAYQDPKRSVHGHYLDPAGRIAVAEELNSAILGRSPSFLLALPCCASGLTRDSVIGQIVVGCSGAAIPADRSAGHRDQ